MTMIAQSTIITGLGLRPHRVVIYKRDHDLHPYVVHLQIERDGSRHEGTYTASIAEAAEEFERRCKLRRVRDDALKAVFEDGEWVDVA